MDKFDGATFGPVHPAAVKQVAGRAGRHGTRFPAVRGGAGRAQARPGRSSPLCPPPQGFSTTLNPDDLPYLHRCLSAPSPPIPAAGLFPTADQLRAFAAQLPPDTPLSELIDK